MQVWPAIDLRGGKCVRLRQGDYQQETIFSDDPVTVAVVIVPGPMNEALMIRPGPIRSQMPLRAEACSVWGGLVVESAACHRVLHIAWSGGCGTQR